MTVPVITLEPIVNARIPYVNGFSYKVASNTTLTINDGQGSDSSNQIDISVSTVAGTTTLSTAVVGVNGIDTGTIAASTMYALYVISDTLQNNRSAFILSLLTTGPNLPTGYGAWRRIGWALTDGSSNLLPMWLDGQGSAKRFQWDTPISVLSAGHQTSTFAAVNCITAIPLMNTVAILNAKFTPNAATDTAQFRVTGSAATSGQFSITGAVAAVAQDVYMEFPVQINSTAIDFDYELTSGSDALTVLVVGFIDYL